VSRGMKLLQDVLTELVPSKDDEKNVVDEIKHMISKIKVKDATVILGGSGEKGTWLRNAKDVDLFVAFNYKKYWMKSDELSDLLEKALKKKFKKIHRLHGSRDYFQVRSSILFEIIPILDIKHADEAINITDVSPLHATFVKKAISKKKTLANDIRLMKQFCKAQNVYGAESYIKGFSGYMCEILVIKYGGFLPLLKASSKWKSQEIIDLQNFYKGKNVLLELNKSKLISPMILIDPVQEDRNAAAALDDKKYTYFIKQAKAFLKNPSQKFFEERALDLEKLQKDHVVIEAKVLTGKKDVVGGKLLKSFSFILKELEKEGFSVVKNGWQWDEGKTAYYYIKAKDADKIKIVTGPPTSMKDEIKRFKKHHKKTVVSKGRVYGHDKRKITDVTTYITTLLKEPYVTERTKEVKILE